MKGWVLIDWQGRVLAKDGWPKVYTTFGKARKACENTGYWPKKVQVTRHLAKFHEIFGEGWHTDVPEGVYVRVVNHRGKRKEEVLILEETR